MSRPHVVIIGSGFGGIRTAKGLAKARVDVDITIIDANNFHTFQPLLYQVATAGLDADDIGFPIRGIFRRNRSVQFALGEVTGIDLQQRSVTVRDGRRLRTSSSSSLPAPSARRSVSKAWRPTPSP